MKRKKTQKKNNQQDSEIETVHIERQRLKRLLYAYFFSFYRTFANI